MANMMFEISSSSVMSTLPTATPRHSTFFSWNLIVLLTSVTLALRSSAWEMGVGNLPALERPGPRRRGICLMSVSEATKASYLRASFLISFLFLLSFFRSSADMASKPWCLARSMSCWSPRMLLERASQLRAPPPVGLEALWCQGGEHGGGGAAHQTDMPGRGTLGSLTVP